MIVVDEEFQKLIPPLTEEEFKQLEENCVKEGIRDPLVVWEQEGKDILIDGHNRWKISAHHGGIQFSIVKKQFKDRGAVKEWIITNQFGRRNLTPYDRSLLALKLKPIISEKAEKNLHLSEGKGCQKSDKVNAIDTKKELAKIAGVSHDTIHKVEKIEAEATPQTKEKLRKGELSINQAYNSTFPKMINPVEEALEEHEEFQEKVKDGVVEFKDVQRDKLNQEIITTDFIRTLYGATNDFIKFGFSYKPAVIETQINKMSSATAKNLLEQFKNCRDVADKTIRILERRLYE